MKSTAPSSLSDPVRGRRGLQHHQRVDREHDRRQQLRAQQSQPVDEQRRRVVPRLAHQATKTLQVYW